MEKIISKGCKRKVKEIIQKEDVKSIDSHHYPYKLTEDNMEYLKVL